VDSRVSGIEKAISEMQTSALQGLKSELTTLQSINTDFASKIKDLFTQNSTLQEQLQLASSDVSTPSPSNFEPLPSTFDVADDIAEHDRQKKNIIVYNLPEQSN